MKKVKSKVGDKARKKEIEKLYKEGRHEKNKTKGNSQKKEK